MSKIRITSEIGKLKKIILHRPGLELERISPSELENVLFEDIPWMKKIKEEHDGFADVLSQNGAQVLYLEDMLCEVLKEKNVREQFVEEILSKEVLCDAFIIDMIRDFLLSLDEKTLTKHIIAGLSVDDVNFNANVLSKYIKADYSYYFGPLPNLYFMRDPGAVIGEGIVESVMSKTIRQREASIIRYLYKYSPEFKDAKIYYDNEKHKMTIEGGDILVLSKDTVVVGASQRTSAFAIESLAKELFSKSDYKRVIAVKLPHVRAFMHLDTVFTMLDRDKFTIYPGIIDTLEVASIFKGAHNKLVFSHEENLKTAIENALGIQGIRLLQSGGNNPVTAEREQWNDSTNTFALSPGVVVTYDRNEVSNEILTDAGIEVLSIAGSELVRGRGGPRCMSMPILREDI